MCFNRGSGVRNGETLSNREVVTLSHLECCVAPKKWCDAFLRWRVTRSITGRTSTRWVARCTISIAESRKALAVKMVAVGANGPETSFKRALNKAGPPSNSCGRPSLPASDLTRHPHCSRTHLSRRYLRQWLAVSGSRWYTGQGVAFLLRSYARKWPEFGEWLRGMYGE